MKTKRINDHYLNLLIFLSIISTILILFWVLKFSSYGIDFTDEGYYLNWISNPYLYKVSLSQFGFIYHPFYSFFNENIISLRKFNFLLTIGITSLLSYQIINKIKYSDKINMIFKIILSSSLSINSITYLYLQTPSYNHLTLQGLLFTCYGLFLIDKINFNKNLLAHLIIGFGGWLTFMAKPSSGFGLSLLIFIYFIFSKNFSLRFILVAISTSILLLLISALAIDGSITKYFQRYILSLEISKLLQSGYDIKSLFRIDALDLSNKIKLSILVIYILSIFSIYLEFYYSKLKLNLIVIFNLLLLITLFSIMKMDWNPDLGYHQPYLIFGVIYASVSIYITLLYKGTLVLKDITWSYIFLLLIIPYIFALGTNNNYWLQSGIASIFWLFIGFILITSISLKLDKLQLIFMFIMISQLVTSIHIKERIENPYRYNESLRLSNTKIELNSTNQELLLSTEFAKYVKDARGIAEQSGFQKGDPIIDLSGRSPGLLYLLGAKSIGTAWNMGGYKGSLDVAKAKFDLVDCSAIANSWILYEPNQPISISTNLLENYGLNFPSDYQLVGSWKVPKFIGGYKKNSIQSLYKNFKKKDSNKICTNKKND